MFSGTLKDGKKETSAVETADPEVISEKPAESTSPEINSEPIKSLEQETPKQLELFEERLLAPESRSRHKLIGQLFHPPAGSYPVGGKLPPQGAGVKV